MPTLQIPVKYTKDEVLYTIKEVKSNTSYTPCEICEGTGSIIYKNKIMKCPNCKGSGRIKSDKTIHIVCDDVFEIFSTKININYDGSTFVRYKGKCGDSMLVKAENNLFESREEAQLKCDELNKEKLTINIDHIIIQDSFKLKRPSIDKINKKLEYYKVHKGFEKDIVVNKNNVLQDGYINFLIFKMMNVDRIRVSVEDVGKNVRDDIKNNSKGIKDNVININDIVC